MHSTLYSLYLFESTVKVKLPPIEVVRIEREVIVRSTVAGVWQNIATAFGKTEKYVSVHNKLKEFMKDKQAHQYHIIYPFSAVRQTHPALRNSSLTMFFNGTHTRGGSFLMRRWENCPNTCKMQYHCILNINPDASLWTFWFIWDNVSSCSGLHFDYVSANGTIFCKKVTLLTNLGI